MQKITDVGDLVMWLGIPEGYDALGYHFRESATPTSRHVLESRIGPESLHQILPGSGAVDPGQCTLNAASQTTRIAIQQL
jgi:hypothetical protein